MPCPTGWKPDDDKAITLGWSPGRRRQAVHQHLSQSRSWDQYCQDLLCDLGERLLSLGLRVTLLSEQPLPFSWLGESQGCQAHMLGTQPFITVSRGKLRQKGKTGPGREAQGCGNGFNCVYKLMVGFMCQLDWATGSHMTLGMSRHVSG